MRRPLVVTEDDAFLDDLLQVAAAAQVELLHARAPMPRSLWREAPAVLLDTAAVPVLAGQNLPRRDGVCVVTRTPHDAVDWPGCLRLGAGTTVAIGEGDGVLIALLTDATDPGPGDGVVVAVISAVGGAGGSTFSAALALNARRRALLVDTDRSGGGLRLLLGVEGRPGTRWDTLSASAGRLPGAALHRSLPQVQGRRVRSPGVSILGHGTGGGEPVSSSTMEVVVRSARRSGDLLVADVPRHGDPGADTALELADRVVVLTTADLRGAHGCAAMADRLDGSGVMAGLVVRGPSPGGLGASEIAEAVGLPLWAAMRPEPGLHRWTDQGTVADRLCRGPLRAAARRVLDELPDVTR